MLIVQPQRLADVEAILKRITQDQSAQVQGSRAQVPSPHAPDRGQPAAPPGVVPRSPISILNGTSRDALVAVANDYLKYYEYQPFAMFDKTTFVGEFLDFEPELKACVIALVSRITNEPCRSISIENVWSLAMDRIARGVVELSTIQALALISMVEFDGKTFHDTPGCN